MLMMFYTTVGGWMLYYCVKSLRGDFAGASPEAVTQSFSDMLGNAPTMMTLDGHYLSYWIRSLLHGTAERN